MPDGTYATLQDVCKELGISYHSAWKAARSGRLPAFQLLGPNTAWRVVPGWQGFISKSMGGAQDEDNDDEFKAG